MRSIVGLLSTNGKRGEFDFHKKYFKTPVYLSRLFINTSYAQTVILIPLQPTLESTQQLLPSRVVVVLCILTTS